MNKHIKWVVDQWKAQKWFVLIMVFFTLLSAAVAISFPFVFRVLIDLLGDILKYPAKHPNPMKDINKIIFMFLLIGLAQLIASLYPSFRAMVNYRFEHSLRMFYFKYIVDKDYRFFQKFRTGDVVTRLTDDLSSEHLKISWFLCSGIFRAINSMCSILFSLAVMFYINWKLTFLSIASLPVMIFIFYITSDKLYKNFLKNQQAISEINNQLEMSFSGIRIIKAFVCEEKYNRFFNVALANRFQTEMKVVKLNAILHLIYEYIGFFAQIGVIIFGGYMAVKGQISVGTFFMFYSYLAMMIYPLLDLPQLLISGKQAFVNIDRLEEIQNFPIHQDNNADPIILTDFSNLRFDKVSFIYEGKESAVIKDLSFTLNKGEKLVILGSTGSGKSTISKLISAIIKPSEGIVYVNDTPIHKIDIYSWREMIGYVPQDAVLFSGTIKDNVSFAVDEYSQDEYLRSIKIAQLESELNSFPDGEMTIVGQKGIGVSGGQKQRITIARALMKKPQLLIMDDITASLDAENEEKLWAEIRDNYQDIAAVVISHRLSTLRYIDRILYIDPKGDFHLGTHDELIFKNKDYHAFVHEHLKVT